MLAIAGLALHTQLLRGLRGVVRQISMQHVCACARMPLS